MLGTQGHFPTHHAQARPSDALILLLTLWMCPVSLSGKEENVRVVGPVAGQGRAAPVEPEQSPSRTAGSVRSQPNHPLRDSHCFWTVLLLEGILSNARPVSQRIRSPRKYDPPRNGYSVGGARNNSSGIADKTTVTCNH